ncbi:MAG: peptide ABC transporter substrate-binding protein [Chloroflexi bacterium]|nr:peptide ABC transporter substrate-binding protein [Chloroflexota bacterium]
MQKRLFGILASVAIIVAACGGASATSAPPASTEPGASTPVESASAPAASESNLAADQTLNVTAQGEPPTLDPNKAQDSNSITILRGLVRGLVYFDKDLKIVPGLASSWDISADAKTLTFHLRDAKYSNGDPIVAGDFVYSIKRLVDPRTAAPYSYVTSEIDGAPDLLAMAGQDPAPSDATVQAALDKLGVSAPDDKTVVIKLNTPASYFLTALTLWVFVPIQEKWITSPNATEAGNYVSSGPFVLDSWQHNTELTLKPNPNWWGDVKPTLTTLNFFLRNDPTADQAAFEAGELDMVQTPSPDIQRVMADPVLGPQVQQIPQFAITYYGFNNFGDPKLKSYKTPGPTANKDFRIALTQAIDKQAFIDATFAGVGQVANSFVMPGIPGYQPDLNPYPYNLDAAKASMAKALAALGKTSAADLGKLKFGFNTGAGHEPRVAFLAEAWRQAFGLETEQIGSDFSVFLTQRTAGQYDIARDGWGADYPHANNQLNGLFTCGGGNNDVQYCNKDFDALIKQAAAEPDQDKQVALYNQAQTILMNDAALLPLRFGTTTYEIAPYVSGITATGSDSVSPGELFWETMQILQH